MSSTNQALSQTQVKSSVALLAALASAFVAVKAKQGVSRHLAQRSCKCKAPVRPSPAPATPVGEEKEAAVGGGKDVLTEQEAELRAKQISRIAYNLKLDIARGPVEYQGDVTISFHYTPQEGAADAFLDFVMSKSFLSIKINGQSVSEGQVWQRDSNRVLLPHALLKPNAENTVEISYLNAYDTTGAGFHKFDDPEDKQMYLYTNFEPFDCHRMLPCFDQPNLKAELTLTVRAPAEWHVLANGQEVAAVQEEDGKVLNHVYQRTWAISTYLFAVVAGPFHQFLDSFVGRSVIPLGWYCRQSLVKHVQKDVEELFTITKNGFQFYEEFFDYAYPFVKYDQIFCPEFNAGAMENVACVTYGEHLVFRDAPTIAERTNRADTILHEMAHMWFGNLVSPVWWDGLWLNESFATYMAALATAEATEFGQVSWQLFNSGMKAWAYREDQLVTTHPVAAHVADTAVAMLIFDGITYGKGCSLLKQLNFVLGEEGFKCGLQHYFKKHEWGNTTIDMFLEALEHGAKETGRSDFDHHIWSAQFLEKAGLNSVCPLIKEDEEGIVRSFQIEQTAPADHPTLRNHHLELACFQYRQEHKAVELAQVVKVALQQHSLTTVPELHEAKLADAVFLNYNDHAYVKTRLDAKSREFIEKHLDLFPDALLRQMLWTAFFDMTRDGLMSSAAFLRLVRTKLSFESMPKLLDTVLSRAVTAFSVLLPSKLKPSEGERMFDFTLKQALQTADDQARLLWMRSAIAFASSLEAVNQLVPYLEGQQIGEWSLPQNLRWSVVKKAMAWSHAKARALLDSEKQRDPSDVGDRQARACETSAWDVKVKEEAWTRFNSPNLSVSNHQASADMSGFWWSHQKGMLGKFSEAFFKNITQVSLERNTEFSRAYFAHLCPFEPENDALLQRMNDLLATIPESQKVLRNDVLTKIDDLKRARMCRDFTIQQELIHKA